MGIPIQPQLQQPPLRHRLWDASGLLPENNKILRLERRGIVRKSFAGTVEVRRDALAAPPTRRLATGEVRPANKGIPHIIIHNTVEVWRGTTGLQSTVLLEEVVTMVIPEEARHHTLVVTHITIMRGDTTVTVAQQCLNMIIIDIAGQVAEEGIIHHNIILTIHNDRDTTKEEVDSNRYTEERLLYQNHPWLAEVKRNLKCIELLLRCSESPPASLRPLQRIMRSGMKAMHQNC